MGASGLQCRVGLAFSWRSDCAWRRRRGSPAVAGGAVTGERVAVAVGAVVVLVGERVAVAVVAEGDGVGDVTQRFYSVVTEQQALALVPYGN